MEADFKLRPYDHCSVGVYILVWRSNDLAKFAANPKSKMMEASSMSSAAGGQGLGFMGGR